MTVFSCEQPVVEGESRVQFVNFLAGFKDASCVFTNNRLTVSDLIGYILFARLGPLMNEVCVSGMSFFYMCGKSNEQLGRFNMVRGLFVTFKRRYK